MRPHRKPSTSAAKIAQTITNVTVIEHILGLGRQLAAQEVTESFLLDWLDLSCGFQVSESAMKETRRLGKGTQQLTEARTVDPAQSSGRKLGITRGVVEPILRWLAETVTAVFEPFRYFSRPTYPASSDLAAEKPADDLVEGAQAVVSATEDAVARPTTVKSFASPVTADVMVDPDVNRAARLVLDDQEIQRRRDSVRTLFNDFWTGADEKPASFVERLDQAEDYVNERLAASGEFWQLDAKTRVMLGLPPRANSPNNRKNSAARD